jgi:hypothetical protein
MDHGHLIREQRYALLVVRTVQKITPFRRSDGRFSICGLREAGFFEVHGRQSKQFEIILQICEVYSSTVLRPRVQHTRSKYVSRYPPTASLHSRSISCGSQPRHTRCTRECGCAARDRSSGDGSQLRTLATSFVSKSCTRANCTSPLRAGIIASVISCSSKFSDTQIRTSPAFRCHYGADTLSRV